MDPVAASVDPSARRLALAGAVLLLLAFGTGSYIAAAKTGRISADPHIASSAHGAGLVGALILFAGGWMTPMLRFGPAGRARLSWLFIVSAFSVWALTCVRAHLRVDAVTFTGDPANDVMFVLLTALVALPSGAGTLALIVGLRAPPT